MFGATSQIKSRFLTAALRVFGITSAFFGTLLLKLDSYQGMPSGMPDIIDPKPVRGLREGHSG
jgi:hypothetical protein